MNSANYDEIVNTTTVVGTNGSSSYYGTYDQCGNVYEWTEGFGPKISNKETRFALGGRYVGRNSELGLRSDYAHYFPPEQSGPGIGFRICSHGYGNVEQKGILQKNPSANPLNFSSFVIVGDPFNEPDISVPIVKDELIEWDKTRYGSVDYEYLIQKFPTTVIEYCEFLNAVASNEDTNGLWNINMLFSSQPIINREKVNNKFSYYPLKNKANKPVVFVSWYNCLRFINWLSNGKPTDNQNNLTTEDGTYNLSSSNIIRNSVNPNTGLPPTYWLTSHDEWYKAAYYKGNGKDSGYWTFATQSDNVPQKVTGDILENGSSSIPIPNHLHSLEEIRGFSGLKGIINIELENCTLEFNNGILVNYKLK
jgi:formylglycine-generating enzyme required for sulfatase activity